MPRNPLVTLAELGQSIWLDYIDRRLLDGTLERLIREDRLAGLTSNPAIFEKAISSDTEYAASLAGLRTASADKLYETLVLADIGRAADEFRPVYEATDGRDGYVSIEVSPHLARDTAATVREARALWAKLERPNILIKVPGTREGLPAFRELISAGINVNVTLLFSVGRYVEVLDAYMEGLEARRARGLPLAGVASVASFFLSRIDVKVDALLDAIATRGGAKAEAAKRLRGQAAIASAGFAYRRNAEITAAPRWQALRAAGAAPQRLLWASTGTKDPAYSDIKYVEALIAPDTVNTLPVETLDAYRRHGKPALRIEQAVQEAPATLRGLVELGIEMHAVDDALEEEGIEKFVKPYRSLLASIEKLRAGAS